MAEADLLDQASEATAAELERSLARVRALNAPERHPDFDGSHCVECDGEIPQARLDLGRIRCVYCAERREAKLRQFGR